MDKPRPTKIILWLLFVVFPVFALSQGGSNENNFGKMVDFLPPPPNAAAIIKSGNIAVNKNNGAINISIPLLSLKSRRVGTNVSISYNSTGIKVDEIASRVGMGWSLQAGGVVTRTLRGTPDEVNPRIVPWATVGQNIGTFNFMDKIASSDNFSGFDGEPDLFSFNINGVSGSFVFDASMNVVPINATNVRIYKDFGTNASWNFKIVGTDGTIYYFGGASATEKTKREQVCAKSYEFYMPTSWYIKSIKHPNGDSIAFNYTAHEYTYESGVTQTMHSVNSVMGGGQSGTCTGGCSSPAMTTCINRTRTQGVLLDEIVATGNAKIKFYYTTRTDCNDKLVTRIELINSATSTVLNAYEFNYTTYTANSTYHDEHYAGHDYTPFLTSLVEKSGDNSLSKPYYFSYNDPAGRAPRLSFSQDHWGYFNGRINDYFVPKPDDAQIASKFPLATANREANFIYAVKGSLSKIVYPTGGLDSIIYESNKFKKNYQTAKHQWECSATGTGFNTQVIKTFSFSIAANQTADIYISCSDNSGIGEYDPLHNKGLVEIRNSSNAVVYSKLISPTQTAHEYPILSSGNYTLKVSANGSVVTTYATFKYYPFNLPFSRDEEVGGLRTRAIFTAIPNEKPILKEYKYGEWNNPDTSSLYDAKMPIYIKTYNKWNYCPIEVPPSGYLYPNFLYCGATSMHSNSLVTLFDYNGSPVSYASVIESIGENFSGGATQSKFMVGSDSRGWKIWDENMIDPTFTNIDMLESPLNNTSSFLNGKLKEEIVYKKNGSGTLFPLKKQLLTYRIDSIKSVYGYVVNRALDLPYTVDTTCNLGGYGCVQGTSFCGYHCLNGLQQAMKLFRMYKYETAASWVYNDSVTNIQYDETGTNPIINIVRNYFENGSYPDLLTKTETYNSKGDLIKTENKYPHNYVGQAIYDSMVAINMVAPVVSTKSFNGATQMAEVKTSFKNWGSGNYDPDSVLKSILAGPLEEEGLIKQRDHFGNILEYVGKDGIVNSIIWGYSYLYPVAKIIGATYSQATAQLSVSMATLQSMDGSALQTELNRIRTGLTAAHVTTYTFKHLVGVLTITDPNNKTNTYEYDGFNRLKIIKDQDAYVVKKIDYSYATPDPNSTFTIYFNDQLNQIYNCQPCATGFVATGVTYTVPANRYYSLISPEDANLKAAADAAANGQKYANRNAFCYASSSNCIGLDKKFLNCRCETGLKIYTQSTQISQNLWQCTYHYEWSDGSWSENYTEYSSSASCILMEE